MSETNDITFMIVAVPPPKFDDPFTENAATTKT